VLTPVVVEYPRDPGNRAGWKALEGQTAAVLIPPSYEILDFAGVFMELMFGVMEAFVQGFTDLAFEIGEEMGATPQAEMETPDLGELPEVDFLIAVEEASQSAIILVSVDVTETTTTEDLLNQALSDTEADFEPHIREKYLDSPYSMERVILDVEDEEIGPGIQIIYVILAEDQGWNVVFTTPADSFDQYLPLFESTIQSFTIAE
jgi:hypothetical protein